MRQLSAYTVTYDTSDVKGVTSDFFAEVLPHRPSSRLSKADPIGAGGLWEGRPGRAASRPGRPGGGSGRGAAGGRPTGQDRRLRISPRRHVETPRSGAGPPVFRGRKGVARSDAASRDGAEPGAAGTRPRRRRPGT